MVSSFFQHGSNAVETIHSVILRKFKFLKYHEIHLPFVPYYQIIIKNAMNINNTESLIKDKAKNEWKYDDDMIQRLYNIKAVQNSGKGVDGIRATKLDLLTYHGYLYFPEIDRTAKTWLKGL